MVYQIVTSMSDLIGNWLGVVGWGGGENLTACHTL